MFKKLKDKLTEEVKIPSQKFTQSMQQLAQAVVSPSSSNNSTLDSTSNDNFSIDGDFDDTPQGSPIKSVSTEGGVAYRGGQATPIKNSFDAGSGSGFMHIDLERDTSTPKMSASLRSSISSLASDSSFMFPVLESSGSSYNFQSDLESCSEASESVGPNINKEQLLVAYQKIQKKYHKYKGRYADLARHYRDLDRDNKNAKHILTESQDKALRRMAELKEQSNLEKQAKAHLEEALRSDLEEKDHLIDTLKTKIKLLRNQADQIQAGQGDERCPASEEAVAKLGVQEDLLTGADNAAGLVPTPTIPVLTPEPANTESENVLKEKVKKMESLLHKCKEDITNKRENIKQLESDKNAANTKLEALQQELITIQKREEEASLSLAKNKQTIHRELESKEDEIKKLNSQLTATNGRVSELQGEISKIKEDSKKEVAASKAQIMNVMKTEMEEILAQKRNLEERLASKESEFKLQEEKISELLKRLEQQESELVPLKKAKDDLEEKFNEETEQLKGKINQLQESLATESGNRNKIDHLKTIFVTVQELNGLHKQLKNDFSKSQTENKALISQQAQLIEEKVKMTMSDLTQEHQSVLSELDEYKRESINARERLSSVSNKFALLQQTLLTETGEVEVKITELKKELGKSEQYISTLEENLESERSARHLIEQESSQKLSSLQKELIEEKSKKTEALEGSSSTEVQLKCVIEKLQEQIKEMEEERTQIVETCESINQKANTLQITIEQYQQEIEFFKTRDQEAMNEMTSMRILLENKNMEVEKLQDISDGCQSKLEEALTKNEELQQKLSNQKVELQSQISEIQSEFEGARGLINKLQEEESLKSNENKEHVTSMQKEITDKENQISKLLNSLQSLETKLEKTEMKKNELEKEQGDLLRKLQEKESEMSTLKVTCDTLSQSMQQLESDHIVKAVRIKDLESSSSELEKVVSENLQTSSNLMKFEEDLQVRMQEVQTLKAKLEEVNISCSKLEELLESKTDECADLTQEINKVKEEQSEQIKMLHQKSDECMKLGREMETFKDDKVQEFESMKSKLVMLESEKAEGSEKCLKLMKNISDHEKEKLELSKTLTAAQKELEKVTSELQLLRQESTDQSKTLQKKSNECISLISKIDSMTAEYETISQQLCQKTIECADKEAQLDSLADEMKRVEELSQELHRINDDRDANVEVLSTEASSLAQKVEELTISTQELKEREVDLLSKLQVAQDLEAEYVSTKQREEALLSKLHEAKAVEIELKAYEEGLSEKTRQIEELKEENKKLKEAGQDLDELIRRAKEAEANCEKLQSDGAGLLLRIQKAEESEVRCSLLEEELNAIKKKKAEMSQELEELHAKIVFRETLSDERSSTDTKEPVIEEPCTIKRYADLTESEDTDGTNWKEKYEKLLEKHQITLQENAGVMERLKEEETILAGVAGYGKRKERLWDQHDSLRDGNSNGSFVAVEKLQQQLTAVTSQLKESKRLHRQEVDDLRRILLNHGSSNSHVSSRSDNLEDSTELEYLRNILFEYMMGKEPMILARVIAAVVKFDSDQTSKVLQKEQQRLSLLGHLGIS